MMNRNEAALKKLADGTVIPAVPLALDSSRKFNEKRQRALFRYYMDAGVGGLAVGVHTTQFAIRNPGIDLFEPLLKVAAEEVGEYERKTGNTVVKISGVCGPAEQAVREAATAKQLGYDAVLLSPAGLNEYSEEQLLDRTRKVANIMPVFGFFLQPATGGRVCSYDYWERLCAIENVVAIKVAAFDRYQTTDVMRAVCSSPRCANIAMYTGNDDNIVIDLLTTYRFTINGKTVEKSFVGGLLGHWAVWTRNVVEMFDEIRKAVTLDAIPAKYITLAAEVTDCDAAFFDAANKYAGCIPGVEEVLRRQGLFEGTWCLNEKEVLSPGQMEEIDRVYAMYPHLNDDAFVAQGLKTWLK
jgi:hypothetical protein